MAFACGLNNCSQKASQSYGWNMDIKGFFLLNTVGIYSLLEIWLLGSLACIKLSIGFGFLFLFMHLFLRFGFLHNDTCASEYRCLPVVFPIFLLRLDGQDRLGLFFCILFASDLLSSEPATHNNNILASLVSTYHVFCPFGRQDLIQKLLINE